MKRPKTHALSNMVRALWPVEIDTKLMRVVTRMLREHDYDERVFVLDNSHTKKCWEDLVYPQFSPYSVSDIVAYDLADGRQVHFVFFEGDTDYRNTGKFFKFEVVTRKGMSTLDTHETTTVLPTTGLDLIATALAGRMALISMPKSMTAH